VHYINATTTRLAPAAAHDISCVDESDAPTLPPVLVIAPGIYCVFNRTYRLEQQGLVRFYRLGDAPARARGCSISCMASMFSDYRSM
jgi:hypothetical protein